MCYIRNLSILPNDNFMQKLIDLIKQQKLEKQPVDSVVRITNEKNESQGAIFQIKLGKQTYKILIPSPHHEALIKEDELPIINTIIKHPEAMQLL